MTATAAKNRPSEAGERAPKKFFLASFRLFAVLSLLTVAALSVSGYFGTLHRYFELASHFPVQYLSASLLCLAALLVLRARRWALVACLCVVLNAVPVLPWFFPPSRTATSQRDVRLLLCNVNAGNTNFSALLNLIDKEAPDVILVQEAGDAWIEALSVLGRSHPYTRFIPNRDNAGILFFSRIPVEQNDEAASFPLLSTRLRIKGFTVSLLSLHPPPPITDELLRERNEQLAHIATLARQLPQPVIVAGDLNISLWSPYYRSFVRQSGLENARQGFGVLPTYPTYNWPVMIPIDHCLVSGGARVTDCRVGPRVGSDHLPIIIDLAL